MNNTNLEKLTKVLAEIFQLDQADLDFGIYRIMNQKRERANPRPYRRT
jgi:adenine-specific DNA-methyltransferase